VRLALLLILGVGTLVGASTLMMAQTGAYCLQGGKWGHPGNCQFSTYEQCIATAFGTEASCGRNPRVR
jgi:hypothetical protein